ncbi:unnamed protein product, partial [Iphiclides podalirius]
MMYYHDLISLESRGAQRSVKVRREGRNLSARSTPSKSGRQTRAYYFPDIETRSELGPIESDLSFNVNTT